MNATPNGVIEVKLFTSVIEIYIRPTRVAVVMTIWEF